MEGKERKEKEGRDGDEQGQGESEKDTSKNIKIIFYSIGGINFQMH